MPRRSRSRWMRPLTCRSNYRRRKLGSRKRLPTATGIEIKSITGTSAEFQVGGTYRVTGVCRQERPSARAALRRQHRRSGWRGDHARRGFLSEQRAAAGCDALRLHFQAAAPRRAPRHGLRLGQSRPARQRLRGYLPGRRGEQTLIPTAVCKMVQHAGTAGRWIVKGGRDGNRSPRSGSDSSSSLHGSENGCRHVIPKDAARTGDSTVRLPSPRRQLLP